MTKTTFFAVNRRTKRATILNDFTHWEMVQSAFRFGFVMPDGTAADGIGRAKSVKDFTKRANHSGIVIL